MLSPVETEESDSSEKNKEHNEEKCKHVQTNINSWYLKTFPEITNKLKERNLLHLFWKHSFIGKLDKSNTKPLILNSLLRGAVG